MTTSTASDLSGHLSFDATRTAWNVLAERIDALLAAWDAGPDPPHLADFLPAEPPALRRLVLVELVKGIASPEVVCSRYPHINDFELLLDQSRTIVAKFFLHISKKEQKERLLARQAEVEKWWKLSLGDWQERERWDEYLAAYEAAIAETSTPWAL